MARKLILATNISLDGFADHTVGVAADGELHDFFTELLEKTGIELFGRVTYEMMASYWPQVAQDPGASKSDIRFAEAFNAVSKIVFSKTLESAEWMNTTLIREDAATHVAKLKNQDGKDLYVGGVALASSLMKAGLVDEYWLAVHPVFAGSGRRLFENSSDQLKLRLIESRPLKSGAVALHYAKDSK